MVPTAWGYLSERHKGANVIATLKDPDMGIRYGTAHLLTMMRKSKDIKVIAGAYNGAGANSRHARKCRCPK